MPILDVRVKDYYWKFLLTEILKSISENLILFANSQGIETKLFGLMIISMILSTNLMCYLWFGLGLTLDGWISSITFFYLFNLLIA